MSQLRANAVHGDRALQRRRGDRGVSAVSRPRADGADGLEYVASWVEPDYSRSFQVVQTADRALLEQWMANWSDLIDFEVRPVLTSAEAAAAIAPSL